MDKKQAEEQNPWKAAAGTALAFAAAVPAAGMLLYLLDRCRPSNEVFSDRRFCLLVLVAVTGAFLVHAQRMKQCDSRLEYFRRLALGGGKGERIIYLDALRCFCVVLVVALHETSSTMEHLQEEMPYRQLAQCLVNLAHAVNVLFVMQSGALLLKAGNGEESAFSFFRRRYLKVLLPCFLYSLFNTVYAFGTQRLSHPDVPELLRSFFSNDSGRTPHFWLIFVILAAYLSVPLFRPALRNLSGRRLNELILAIILIHVFFCYAPLFGVDLQMSTGLAGWESVLLLGYYCTTEEAERHLRLLLASAAASALFIVYATLCLDNAATLIFNNAPPMILFGCGIFLTFRRLGERGLLRRFWLVDLFSRKSFSVLMIHWLILLDIVPGHLEISGWLGTDIAGGMLAAVVITLAASWVFAFLYDNTIVLFADHCVNFCIDAVCRLIRRRSNE